MNYLNKLLLIILSNQLLMASGVTIIEKKFQDKFCKAFQTEEVQGTFCMNSEIKYPQIKSKDKILKNNLDKAINEYLGRLEKGESKKYVLEAIKNEFASTTEHEEHKIIKILSITPKTFTLEVKSYGYTGGAHGHSQIELINYDRTTGKRLNIYNLFKKENKKRLTKIIEKEYRRQEHISTTDNLDDKLGWFKNKFVLAENIGIAKDGLHLEYNPYEIKPYSGGTTSLVIPYKLLKEVITPKGNLSLFLEKEKLTIKNSKEYSFSDKLLNLKVKVKRISKDKIEINLIAQKSEYSISKGRVSLSFPQLKDEKAVLAQSSKGFEKLVIYPINSYIYNFKSKKNRKSNYLLIEGEMKKWKENEEKSIKIKIKMPKDSQFFNINLRAIVIENKKILRTPVDGKKGQQDVENYIIKLQL